MKLTDFLGNEYGPGDLVLYAAMSGRCANMVLACVTDVYRVWHNSYYVGERYGWERLEDGDPVPHHFAHDGSDLGECDTAVRVKVQPLRGARWEQHSPRTYYTDSRTGKRIDPDARSGKHTLKQPHFVFADGTEFDYDAEKAAYENRRRPPGMYRPFDQIFRSEHQIWYTGRPGYDREGKHVGHESDGRVNLWYVSRTYQPWVEKHEEGPRAVTLEVTGNIVKWEGELPDAEV